LLLVDWAEGGWIQTLARQVMTKRAIRLKTEDSVLGGTIIAHSGDGCIADCLGADADTEFLVPQGSQLGMLPLRQTCISAWCKPYDVTIPWEAVEVGSGGHTQV